MLEFLPAKIERCIEFGCSQGLFLKKVKEKYHAECWGVDMDEESVLMAKEHLDKAIPGDAFSVVDSLPENYFDCLVCNDFLEHLAYPDLFLEKIRKSMKKDAYLVASVPNVRSWSNVIEFLIYKDWKYLDFGILDNTHLRFFTSKSLNRFLTDCSINVEVVKGLRPSSSKLFLLSNILSFGFISDMRYKVIAVRGTFK